MINTAACTPDKAKELIKGLRELKISFMLWGATGVGKSDYSFNINARFERKIANLTRGEFIRVSRWSSKDLYYFLKTQCRAMPEFYAFLAEFDGRDALAGDLRPKECFGCKTCDAPRRRARHKRFD